LAAENFLSFLTGGVEGSDSFSSLGNCASTTVTVRPFNFCSFKCVIAALASKRLGISIIPKPFPVPVSVFFASSISPTSPKASNAKRTSASEISKAKLLT
jgi:hypothetical protein